MYVVVHTHRNYHCLEIVFSCFWQVLRNLSFCRWLALTFIFTLWKFWRINCAAFSNRNISSVLLCKRACSAGSGRLLFFSSSSRLHNGSSSPMLIAKFAGLFSGGFSYYPLWWAKLLVIYNINLLRFFQARSVVFESVGEGRGRLIQKKISTSKKKKV